MKIVWNHITIPKNGCGSARHDLGCSEGDVVFGRIYVQGLQDKYKESTWKLETKRPKEAR